ncbi:23S rRNA (adenine(2503)-C(2))-methyltransferase RlmN [Propionibacteriaceae bacterium Y1700]|uniref:23S rRNA (adenine(2503)-C(2))-methyltransferase RlmN n=1 Tax=Microlunatus sp. Y1700 TaxID=3418487 RepID=UPI003DA78B61
MTESAPTRTLPLVFAAPKKGKPPTHWADLGVDERKEAVVAAGQPAFRASQLSKHWFERFSHDPADWTDLPAALRQDFAAEFFPPLLQEVKAQTCDNGDTEKLLWRLHDGALVESVLMKYPNRTTMCISSQAGCGMACPFCATGKGGLQRNMSTAEIVSQVADGMRRLAVRDGGRVNNVVFMGMGEPLANYKAVLGAVRVMTTPAPDGLGMSARGITVSTVGLVPAINKMTEEGIPVTLALSLHAPDDELRDEIVPINTRWKVGEAVDAAWEYAKRTKRRVSIEYAMMKDINDQAYRADMLASVLKRRGDWGWVHVNLIPLNDVPGSRFTRSRDEDMAEFVRRLEAKGVPTTIRDTRGDEIDAACGQLAATGEKA